MAKRENEGKKEKKQKKKRKIKRKQYRGLLLNPVSVPRARTRAHEGRRLACTCTFREAGGTVKLTLSDGTKLTRHVSFGE